MSIKSQIGEGRGGRFVNENSIFLEASITQLVIKMPHADIPNESSISGIRTEIGPDDVLLTLYNSISSVACVAMYDALGDVEKNEAGDPDFTAWNVWIKTHKISSAACSEANKELANLARQIQTVIRMIPSENSSDYKFNKVTVEVGRHYNRV